MNTSLVPSHPAATTLALAGRVADQAANNNIFNDYLDRKATNTRRRQTADLALFAHYLDEAGAASELQAAAQAASEGRSQPVDTPHLIASYLQHQPAGWRDLSWGLVEGFVKWQLQQGFAVASVNIRLSTLKTYCRLAYQAGALSDTQYALIRTVQGYSRKEARRLDSRRPVTRQGYKKAAPVSISPVQARQLKSFHPAIPQGQRDAFLMCLLLDHGLRAGEIAALQMDNLNRETGELRFYRPKVDRWQTHRLTADSWRAAQAYLAQMGANAGPLLRASRPDGELKAGGLSVRAVTKRVSVLGQKIGLAGLSAHDCRHYWATTAARHGTPIDRLQDAGGWASPAMPLRYIEAAAIANEGVKLG